MVSSSFFMILLFSINLVSLFHSLAAISLCHADEVSALLQFKESFVIRKDASDDPLAYPKTESWKFINGGDYDCCSWDGISCDMRTGHVLGLDLSSSFLYGSINSSSTLFKLVHLRTLNLAFNHFNYSQLPSEFVHFQGLASLNLSSSSFSGQIPSILSRLPSLSQLDLSMNDQLFLNSPDFETFVQNLTALEDLRLDFVDISSFVPNILANLSSLKFLSLSLCNLYGEFPIVVFQIPHLQKLQLERNWELKGHLPEFNSSSSLEQLVLSGTRFSGKLPYAIGNLGFLNRLEIFFADFSGKLPSSLGNLTQLVILDLRATSFAEQTSSSLSWLPKLNKLEVLGLTSIIFDDGITPHFANLTQLVFLSLYHNSINSPIPSWLVNMTQLVFLHLNYNLLQGPIPDLIFQLRHLQLLSLGYNNLTGNVEFAKFLKLKKLTHLSLTGNNLSLLHDNVSSNTIANKFTVLSLGSCNLTHFPNFLRDQDQLVFLKLANNFIHGQVPKWVWNKSEHSLEVIDLSDNLLTGFEEEATFLPLSRLFYLDVSDNMLQGPLPIPPPSIQLYRAARNNLTGQISANICHVKDLYGLDLSKNNFNGELPQCLGNLSKSIKYLNLGSNSLLGMIPTSFTKKCKIRMLFLDSNKLQGQLPKSLVNCTDLEFLILGSNKINDTFPSWLGKLQELKVLILRSNQFYGVVGNQVSDDDFPNLQIVDVSDNYLTGELPSKYFLSWNKMKMVDPDQLQYVNATFIMHSLIFNSYSLAFYSLTNYPYSMSITNKGVLLNYSKILQCFVAVDFSSNRFEGDIPNIIGSLSGLRLLNLSNNNLSGGIPSSLGYLTKLESLDLSQNNLSGAIPQQLTQLNFLAIFNVSNNHLTGPIPQGKQFDTFQSSSYESNLGLCGNPLPRNCENTGALSPLPSVADKGDKDEWDSFFDFGWKSVLIGYGSGLMIGVVIGHIVTKRKHKWFVKTFRVRQPRRRRRQRVRQS